jgi:sugar lactone lactonase YvrE
MTIPGNGSRVRSARQWKVDLGMLLIAALAGSSCNNGKASGGGEDIVESSQAKLSSGLGTLSLLAGSLTASGSTDGAGTSALFHTPFGLTVDSAGNVYVADRDNATIRKITPSGVVTTLAGVAGQAGSADGTGAFARFNSPYGLAVDSAGNVYVGDSSNQTIRKITPSGTVTTLAGYPGLAGHADGTGAAARFYWPVGVALDGQGNLFVADAGNHTIRRVTGSGTVTTFAGSPGVAGSTDGTGAAARFYNPCGLAFDTAGNLYVADRDNSLIRKITPSGGVTTLASVNQAWGVAVDSTGNVYAPGASNHTLQKITPAGVLTTLAGMAGYAGDMDGTGSAARFYNPGAIAIDGYANLYVADTSTDIIRKVTLSGVVTTYAGAPYSAGSNDGVRASAGFNQPSGLTVDSSGIFYVADSANNAIRMVSPLGDVKTLAGNPGEAGNCIDGTGAGAFFNYPGMLVRETTGNLFVTDYNNAVIRKITPGGVVTTIAGACGQGGSADGTGAAARFNGPWGIAEDPAGNFYVADSANQTIRRIAPGGIVTTIAGSAGQAGCVDGTGASARFYGPGGLVLDGAGNMYVADFYCCAIRKVTSSGVVTTLAGTLGQCGCVDGNGSTVRLYNPSGIGIDAGANLYVTDYSAATIRKITPSGYVTTLAGTCGQAGTTDGMGSAGLFNAPVGVAVDQSGYVYIGDRGNAAIRKISPSGLVTTLAGTKGQGGYADGTEPARFNVPLGVATDGAGNVYVADTSNNTIRMVNSAGVVTTLAGAALQTGYVEGTGSAARFWHPGAVAVDSSGNVYVADSWNNVVRKLTRSQSQPYTYASSTLAGSSAQLSTPTGIAVDGSGNVYVADTNNHDIRKVTSAGVVSVLAGTPGQCGSMDGTGSSAQFCKPTGIAVDSTGNLYVADNSNNTIRKVTGAGVVTTLAGYPGQHGNNDGVGSAARFYSPYSVTLDNAGNIYVTDTNNYTVRMITPSGTVSTLIGVAGQAGVQFQPLPASLDAPYGIAAEPVTGTLYITMDSAILVASNPLAIQNGGGGPLYAPARGQQTLTALGGRPPYTWSLATNNSGASLTAAGLYTAGSTTGVTDTVKVTDVNGAAATVTITVVGNLVITGTSTMNASPGGQQTLTASGGSGSYSFWLTSNNSGGSITPAGVYTAGSQSGVDTVVVMDADGATGTTVQITVGPQSIPVPAAPGVYALLLAMLLLALGLGRTRRDTPHA